MVIWFFFFLSLSPPHFLTPVLSLLEVFSSSSFLLLVFFVYLFGFCTFVYVSFPTRSLSVLSLVSVLFFLRCLNSLTTWISSPERRKKCCGKLFLHTSRLIWILHLNDQHSFDWEDYWPQTPWQIYYYQYYSGCMKICSWPQNWSNGEFYLSFFIFPILCIKTKCYY